MALSLISGLLPLLLLAAIISGIVSIARRDEEPDADPGIGSVRRLVLYGLAFVAAILGPTGVGLLLGSLFEALSGRLILAESDTELATGLSLSLVGTIAWLLLWRVAASTVERHPVERRSLARHFYFGSVRAVAAITTLVSANVLLSWVFRLDSFEGNALGFLIVAAGVWYGHQRIHAREAGASSATRSVGRLYLFGAAFVGLALLSAGVASLLIAVFEDAYDALVGTTLTAGIDTPVSRDIREALTVLIPGAVAWAVHWWRARGDHASTSWRVYMFLGTLLSGITTAIVSASVALYLALQWFFGAPRSSTAALHFGSLPEALAGLLLGLLLWGYHRSVLAEHSRAVSAPPSETERVYRYLAAAAGLVTLISGLARVLATAVDLLAGASVQFSTSPGWWQNQLVTGVTLLIVGVPLWLRHWRQVEAQAASGGDVERAALSRRIFLYTVFGASGIATLIALSALLFELFQGLLRGNLSLLFLHDARWSIAVLVSAAGAAIYYWQVLRADQRAAPAVVTPPRRALDLTVVNGDDGGALARRLEERLGARRVRTWRRPDIDAYAPTDSDFDALVRQIEAAPGERVLVIATPDGGSVIPYAGG